MDKYLQSVPSKQEIYKLIKYLGIKKEGIGGDKGIIKSILREHKRIRKFSELVINSRELFTQEFQISTKMKEDEEWNEESLGQVVHLPGRNTQSGGTGVLIEGNLVLTCGHAVDYNPNEQENSPLPPKLGKYEVLVTHTGEILLGKCIRVDLEVDLALLQIKNRDLTLPFARISPVGPKKGERVWVVGNPWEWECEGQGGGKLYWQPSVFFTSRGRVRGELTEGERGDTGLGGWFMMLGHTMDILGHLSLGGGELFLGFIIHLMERQGSGMLYIGGIFGNSWRVLNKLSLDTLGLGIVGYYIYVSRSNY